MHASFSWLGQKSENRYNKNYRNCLSWLNKNRSSFLTFIVCLNNTDDHDIMPKEKTKKNETSSPIVARVSRKVKTCDECRRHKIRCSLGPDQQTPCTRCERMKLDCQLTKNLQTILEERNWDVKWRESVDERLDTIFEILAKQENESRNVHTSRKRRKSLSESDRETDTPTYQADTADPLELLANAASGNDELNLSGKDIGQTSASSSKLVDVNKQHRSNIIDRGLLTLDQIYVLVDIYLTYLDPHVYSIVGAAHTTPESHLNITVQSIRRSPLLLLAICTVAALHCSSIIRQNGILEGRDDDHASRLYSTLHDEFVRLSAQQSFVRHQSLDDIRALLIGSWWLRDLSWILTGSSVRLATERGMQEAYKKCSNMTAGKQACQKGSACGPGEGVPPYFVGNDDDESIEQEAYKAARLYYLVYIADHQAAIPFSRPPMTRQHAAVRNVRAWLAGCRLATEEDARLASQVELWVIAHDVLDDFGVDVQEALTRKQVVEEAPRFFALVDRWQKRWQTVHSINAKGPDTVKEDEVHLQAEMMRLFIAAHIFRSAPNVDPLAIQGEETEEQGLFDKIEHRPSFAQRSMPLLPEERKNERTQRYAMGQIAVQTAVRLINLVTSTDFAKKKSMRNWKREGMYGQPIYPFAMLIFACLFLHKLYKPNEQTEGISQSFITLEQTMYLIEKVCQSLKVHLMPFCVDSHICGTVLPGLLALLNSERARLARADKERNQVPDGTGITFNNLPDLHQSTSQNTSKNEALLQQNSLPSIDSFEPSTNIPHPLPESFAVSDTSPIQSGTPVFSFDLQSLDLLSDLRYLSGIGNNDLVWDLSNFDEPVSIPFS